MNIQQLLIEKQIVHSDTEIMSGQLVFVGTRVPLQTFLDYLEGEDGLTEFLDDFPHLQKPIFKILEVTLHKILSQEMTVSARSA